MLVFIVILFVLVKSLFAYHCIELEGSHILDCSRLGISTFPRYTTQNWVEVLILERNNITLVNLSAIMVDLRHNPLDCTRLLRVKIDIASDCSHPTFKPTALAITSTTHCGSISVLSPAAPRTSHVKTVTPSSASVSTPSPANISTPSPIGTGENHIPLVLSILLPAGAAVFVIACLYAIRRMRRRRPSVYDKLFVLNNVRGSFSIDSLSSDSLDDEINYLQDSAF
jgi:hypothetical protein